MKRLCLLATVALLAASAPAQLKAYKKGWWEISVRYPTFHSAGAPAKAANTACRKLEKAASDAFLAEAKKEMPRLKKMKAPGHYTLTVSPAIGVDRPDLVSGYVQRDEYEAGAHPHTSFQAINYGLGGHPVTLRNFVVATTDPIATASLAIISEFKKTANPPSAIANGTWKRLDADQAKRFVVTQKGLLFLFDEADLGAHAEGYFKILVPFEKLAAQSQIHPGISASHPLYGRWVLESIQVDGGPDLKPESQEADWIKFDDKGRLTGKASANTISGPVALGDPPALKIGPLISTRIADPPHSIAPQFLKALQEADRYSIKDLKLVLELPRGAGFMTFRRG